VGDFRIMKRFALPLRWRADCEEARLRVHQQHEDASADRHLDPGALLDADRYRVRYDNGLRAVFNSRAAGNRVSARRWRGIFRVNVRVLRGSDLLDRCYLRTRWRVLRQT
jgi:hypothetical protein